MPGRRSTGRASPDEEMLQEAILMKIGNDLRALLDVEVLPGELFALAMKMESRRPKDE